MLPGALLLLLGLHAPPHPLHSSSAILREGANGRIILSVRIFSDDLGTVAPGGDSAVANYVRRQVRLSTADGRLVAFDVATITRDGDLTQVTAHATAAGGLTGGRVQLAILWERYQDQVNLLRVTTGGRNTTLVFANGDPPRELR
jgi:hypothetical protein